MPISEREELAHTRLYQFVDFMKQPVCPSTVRKVMEEMGFNGREISRALNVGMSRRTVKIGDGLKIEMDFDG